MEVLPKARLSVSACACSVVSYFLQSLDCSLPGSSVPMISQARILEWVAIFFSRRSSALAGRFFTTEPPGNPLSVHWSKIKSQRQSFGCSRKFSSVQFSRSIMSNSLQPYGLQHTRLPCPSPTSRVCLNSCPSSQ